MRTRRGWTALAAAACLAALAAAPGRAEDLARILAPTGTLRVGVYLGSPTSLVRDRDGAAHGVSVELGEALARRLGVPVALVEYPRVAAVVEGLRSGGADVTVTNASPARAESVSFTETLLTLELGYLVPPGSSVAAASELDAPGRRVGVTEGGTSERTLSRELPKAAIVSIPSLRQGVEMLRSGAIDAYATNKTALFQMGDDLPGSRVLDGRWGLERLAIAIPKGREAALDDLGAFIAEARSSGLLAGASSRAGLRGAAPAP